MELLILRLSRNSGILGLSGMAFVSQLFPSPLRGSENSAGILLVRPLLEFNKDDMYNVSFYNILNLFSNFCVCLDY